MMQQQSTVEMVSTTIGEIMETDLERCVVTKEPHVFQEWYYKGNDPAHKAHVGTLVRREFWTESVMINTTLGEIPYAHLERRLIKQPDQGYQCATVAQEWYYKGDNPKHAAHVGKLVRGDSWVVIKSGLVAGAVAGGIG